LANESFVIERRTVRVVITSRSSRRTLTWVVTVGARVPPPTTTATTTTTTTIPTTTTTTATTTTTTTIPPTTTTTIPPTTTTTIPPPTTTTLPASEPGYTSLNWSGYFVPTVAGGTTDVQGTWVEPTLNCSATPDAQSAAWVGVDGASNGDLFQTGTSASCSSGAQSDFAWFEELPYAADPFSFPVSPGDTITAHIWQVTPGNWEFTIIDSTSGYEGYSGSGGVLEPISYSGPGESAEWIEEDPLNGISDTLFPFADFQTITFSSISADLSTPTLSLGSNGIEIVQSGTALAVPSAPSGSSFTVTYG
jgi:hypothetical protein